MDKVTGVFDILRDASRDNAREKIYARLTFFLGAEAHMADRGREQEG